jgi:hypothetical protein
VWFLKRENEEWRIIGTRARGIGGFERFYLPIRMTDFPLEGGPASEETVVLSAAKALRALGADPGYVREVIGMYDSPNVREFLEELSGSPDTVTRLVTLSQLLDRGDVDALRRITESQELQDLIVRESTGAGLLISRAIGSFFRNTDETAIHLLGELANDQDADERLREASALALSSLHTSESVPYLARLLDAETLVLRKRAVIGLSFFANGVGIQDSSARAPLKYLNEAQPNEYSTAETRRFLGFNESREDEFVGFWKQWWLLHQADFE